MSGGTGGAKLARGLLGVVGADQLVVIANTADDIEIYGVHVSPDPDLITYWLADAIDERGYGLRDDTFAVMKAFEEVGVPTWFRLGDRDLAMCMLRTEALRTGERLTRAHARVVEALGVDARVLPMADEPVATRVRSRGQMLGFQEFMIVERAALPIDGVELDGIEAARPTAEVLDAVQRADVVVLGPSNPVISIDPILALPGMRDAVAATPAPVVAVSPFVGGRAVKGPTEPFCEYAGIALSAQGIADHYSGLIQGVVADEPVEGIRAIAVDTLMHDSTTRARLAEQTLEFASSL